MASMTISVPDPLRDWIETRLAGGGYDTPSDDGRDLIGRDGADSDEREALVAASERGEASGLSERRAPEILTALERGGRCASLLPCGRRWQA